MNWRLCQIFSSSVDQSLITQNNSKLIRYTNSHQLCDIFRGGHFKIGCKLMAQLARCNQSNWICGSLLLYTTHNVCYTVYTVYSIIVLKFYIQCKVDALYSIKFFLAIKYQHSTNRNSLALKNVNRQFQLSIKWTYSIHKNNKHPYMEILSSRTIQVSTKTISTELKLSTESYLKFRF